MRHIGVTTIEGIRERCRIDSETSCWNWAWGKSDHAKSANPAIHIGKGVMGLEKTTTMSAYRAAWLLAGKKIKPGHVVYRTCCNTDCCNPSHLKSGARTEMYSHYASSGKNKGQPHRALANAKNRAKMMVPVDRVRLIESLLAEGKKVKEIKVEAKMCAETIRNIRDGRHPNCANPIVSGRIRGASVFDLAGSL